VNGPIERVNPLEDAGWDARLKTCPAASFFYSAAWARVLNGSYGYSPVYFVQNEAGQLRSLLPIMEVDSWLTGRRGVSLPFTDHCEPISPDPASFRAVFQEVMVYAKERGWKYLECRGGRAFFPDAMAATAFYGHELILDGKEENLFSRLEGRTRTSIRKAEKSEVQVEILQDLDSMKRFYGLMCVTRKRHGLPPQPFTFFQKIHRHVLMSDRGFVVLARHGQKTVAGAVFFHFMNNGIYKYSASDEAFRHLAANNLVLWEGIKWFARHGFARLHFGRTSMANEGLRKYKLGWGVREAVIEYVKYGRSQGGFVTAKDEATGWHNRIFRMLPDPASRLIGTALYRHMA
jgi:hypothetical protein